MVVLFKLLVLVSIVRIVETRHIAAVHPSSEHQRLHSDAENVKNYVGIGYDAVFGNPLGSSGPSNDSGYRNLIVESHKNASDQQGNKSQSNGVWTRELSTCWRSDKREGAGDEDLMRDLQNEFQLEGAESNELLEANLRNMIANDEPNTKSEKYTVAKSFCATKEGGIILPFKGNLSPFFLNDVGHLPKELSGIETCTPDVYIAEPSNKACDAVNKWVQFFRRYGTHITSHVIVVKQEVSKRATGDKPDAPENVSIVHNFKSVMKGRRESRQMWVVGGFYVKGLESNDLHALKVWAKSLRQRPMPIRATFTSLDHFLGDKAKVYHEAMQFYRNFQSVANGHSLNYRTFSQMLRETVTVTADDGIARCPANMAVVAGFVVTRTDPMRIDTCIPSRSFCASDVLRGNAIAVALCARGGGFTMTAIESTGFRACPDDLVVAFGFQLYNDGSGSLQVAACPSGREDCGVMPSRNGVEWKVCARRKLLDSSFAPVTRGAREGEFNLVPCENPQKVVSGEFNLPNAHNLRIRPDTQSLKTRDF
ncbi:MAC Perforin domain containing protein, putative [Babesia ovata]|uniref:MAC Perforin domain containing protein, putative n=1 Tax=Babesia ovata TaxID=189622 RepID=A0A2H6KIA8_9APIC|nr:MAC Perforin domain containing protein, putative [Babesia ovata]GBE62730.1 MAC Perforin domain containing protein, putative [Babesia ovata]